VEAGRLKSQFYRHGGGDDPQPAQASGKHRRRRMAALGR
jgi:hypothetical protein